MERGNDEHVHLISEKSLAWDMARLWLDHSNTGQTVAQKHPSPVIKPWFIHLFANYMKE